MENDRGKYPIGAEYYTLYEEVGTGVSASVHRAKCNPLNEIVAIKILDFERNNCDLNNVSREAQFMGLVDHPNVLKSHCSFVSDHNLWVVMPFMSGGSCLHILKAAHPDGFEEVVIATILREVLKGLEYLHQHGFIHRDVKAGNVLIDSRGGIKLGDFGVSACLFDAGDRQRMRNTFVGTPCWCPYNERWFVFCRMAPEVMEQLHGYDFKADIWSFGITALELAHGHAPFSKYPPMKVLLMTLQNAPPGLDYERDKKFSKSFKHMIASCLVKDPSKRPSAKRLLKNSFFKQARSNDYIVRTLMEGLPALGDRLQAIKRKEEDMLAQKKMPDGEKEEISQNEYKRGISGWDFNIEDMKAQASLIQDDDVIVEKDEDIQTKQIQHLASSSRSSKVLEHQLSFASQYSDAADSDDNATVSVSSLDSTNNIAKCEKSDDDGSAPCSTSEHLRINMSFGLENQADSHLSEKPASEVNMRSSEGDSASSNQSDKTQNQSQSSSRTGSINLQQIDAQLDITSKGSKTSVNGEEVDEKAKNPVVQQKGRFKVTSENVEMEKSVPAPTLQKSHSVQVIAQLPAASSPSLSDATPPTTFGQSLFPALQSVLHTNIIQRDSILSLMKIVAVGDSSEMMCTPTNMELTEKSMLEAAHERERELLREINDLQWRLQCAQEELQKYKTENPR